MTQEKTRITFVHDKVLRFMPFSLLCIFFTIELSESCAVCEQMWNFPRNNKKSTSMSLELIAFPCALLYSLSRESCLMNTHNFLLLFLSRRLYCHWFLIEPWVHAVITLCEARAQSKTEQSIYAINCEQYVTVNQ